MIEMMPKWFSALMLAGAAAVPLGAGSAGLQQVQSVYLMPMGYGLDQYIANRLTAESVFLVVTDPKRADAVLTDTIGTGFERRFDDLFPPPPPPPRPPKVETEHKETKAEAKAEKEMDPEAVDRLKRANQFPVSSFSRGKGNIFLVDIKSKSVLWSLYERPKKIVPDELNRTSARIVERLKKDRAGKP
jgi:hypothetical protein